MRDDYTLFAKIRALPKRRIAEVEDFVDFLTLRRSQRAAGRGPAHDEKPQATYRALPQMPKQAGQ